MAEKEKKEEQFIAGMPRRTFVLGVGGAVAALGLGTLKLVNPDAVVRPPGAQDEAQMLTNCIHCMKCVEACPRHIIVPAHLEDGLLTMRTPKMNFADNWCNWCAEENNGVPLCASACPTKAFTLDPAPTPENTILGVAEINRDWCLAWRFKGCRFCLDACPEEAVVFNADGMPTVDVDKCNGCGACYTVCVSLSEGSILSGMTDRAIVVKPVQA